MSELIFRIQDRQGRGPWKPGFSDTWVQDRADLDNLIPWPIQFGNVLAKHRGYNFGCGCRTIEQLKRWFIPVEYYILESYGYDAVTMEVDKILAESDIQLVFAKLKQLRWEVQAFELYPPLSQIKP